MTEPGSPEDVLLGRPPTPSDPPGVPKREVRQDPAAVPADPVVEVPVYDDSGVGWLADW